MRGANYVPSYAKNDVAIWMDYDPGRDRPRTGLRRTVETQHGPGVPEQAVYEHNPKQFLERLESSLTLCDKHRIQAMLVLFDSCFDPQVIDLKDYRSNWIPSPGFARLPS